MPKKEVRERRIANGVCVNCGSPNRELVEGSRYCLICKLNKTTDTRNYKKNVRIKSKSRAKILLFDIETLPMEVLVWGLYKQRIPHENILKNWSVVSWAAKWLFDNEVMSDVVKPKAAVARSDSGIIEGIWSLLDEADIIIAHNGRKFDTRRLNARFMVNGLSPPSSYYVIDTLQQSYKYTAFASHRLDSLAKTLGKTRKIKTEYELWKRCAGVETTVSDQWKALQEMVHYNKQDVLVLEDFYVELRPWIKSHPNIGLYFDTDKEVCPNCGSNRLTWKGYYYTTVNRYKAFRCECGAVGRSRFSDLSTEERKLLVTPVAR